MPKVTVRHPVKSKRVGVAQVAPVLGDLPANLAAHVAAVDRARSEKIDLLVFPELSLTGYRLKDSVPGIAALRSGKEVAELARLSEEVSFVAGLVEEDARHNFYNSSFLFESGHVQSVHRKAYLPTYGMFDEQRYFARGRSLSAFSCRIGRAAILICEDMLHPTAVTIAALDGAAAILVPSASPVKGVTGVEAGQGGEGIDANARHWEGYNRAMARTLGLYVVYANRVGVEDGIAFWGGSEIVGPGGETIAKAPYYEEGFIAGSISQEAVRRRRMQAPVLRDENVDLTVNELCRVIGRVPGAERGRFGDRSRAGGDRARAGGDRSRAGGDRSRSGERRPRANEGGESRERRRGEGRPRREGGGAGRHGQGRGPARGANIERGRLRDALEAADRRRRDQDRGQYDRDRDRRDQDRDRRDQDRGQHDQGRDRHEPAHARRPVDTGGAVVEPDPEASKAAPAPAGEQPEEPVAAGGVPDNAADGAAEEKA